MRAGVGTALRLSGRYLYGLESQVLRFASLRHAPVDEKDPAAGRRPLRSAPFTETAVDVRAPLGDAPVALGRNVSIRQPF
jgi:hypothetical protein